jgi:hypothetical protein
MAWHAVCSKHDKRKKWEYYSHNSFAANRRKTTYCRNVRCMLIIYSWHKTNILSFMHIGQKYGSYFKSKCKPFAAPSTI